MFTIYRSVPTLAILLPMVCLLNRPCVGSRFSESLTCDFLPGVLGNSYSKLGDIDIGAMAITQSSSKTPAISCSERTLKLSYTADTTEAIAFAVDLVNRDPNLLPNVTLGFVLRGVCMSPNVALATSLSFFSGAGRVAHNATDNSLQTVASSESQRLEKNVVGLVSPDKDDLTTMISSLYSVAQIPIVGSTEVGDELSDKSNHPYFFRVAPPSKYQIKAILKFISSSGWSYISILYREGPYGQKAYENMDRSAGEYGICMATSHMLVKSTDYDTIVADLLKYPRARVVVIFVYGSELRKILRGVKNNNATGHFIFLASDLVDSYSGFHYVGRADDPAIGVFTFGLYFMYVMDFYKHLSKQKVATSENPWLRGAYEYIMECSYDTNQTKIRPCDTERDIFKTYRYRTSKSTSLRIDAVLALAHAIHDLLLERCPDARGSDVRSCVTGPLLREYLKRTTFEGYNGHVEFDENQDVKGKYVIGQFVFDYYNYPFTNFRRFKHMTRKNVGVYDSFTDSISYYSDEPITWSHLKPVERVVPWTNGTSPPPEIPESVCSRPCRIGEYRIQKSVSCCWECRTCRENEHLVNGNTSCEACPRFTWPDPSSGFTTCEDIPPFHPAFDDTLPLILASLALFCLVITVVVFTTYVIYRDERVIKASSRELSVIQLVAILVGYTTVIFFQIKPSDIICSAIFFQFSMSFALLYSPLLVKTIRIFRIFTMGIRVEKPRFISNQSQLIFTGCLIAVQATLCVTDYIFVGPKAQRTQPIWSEKYVELSCDLTFLGIASFLSYNIVQVFMCSVFAFKVRSLPDNFNESKFISMCVSTTLLIWLAFIPTYFTADREFVRSFLLSMALLLNHTVALVLLFMPKIYAAMFLQTEKKCITKGIDTLRSGMSFNSTELSTN